MGSKWVFQIKRKADGTIDKYKARLVACGFTQIFRVDYFSTYSPVAKLTSFRTILAIAARYNWDIESFDFNGADVPQARQHARICAEGRLRAQSPMRRSAGPTGRWRGDAHGSATSATQPIQLPTHSDRSPPPTARIGSKLGRNIEHWWYDRSPANWSAAIPRSPAITQDIY